MKQTLTILFATIVAAGSLAAVALSASSAQTIRVTETSNAIRLAAKPKPGTVTFVVRNASDDAHDFWLRGGGKTWKTRVLGEGRSASLTVTLRKGVRYSYWCSISDHRSDGMSGSFIAR